MYRSHVLVCGGLDVLPPNSKGLEAFIDEI